MKELCAPALLAASGAATPSIAPLPKACGVFETRFSIEDADVLRLPFEPLRVMRTGYMIDAFQKTYFVLDSLPQLIEALVDLDFGPLYERWRETPALPAGEVLEGEKPLSDNHDILVERPHA